MPLMKPYRFSFNSGELAPEFWYRTDLSRALSACRYMYNFFPQLSGSAWSRPGGLHVAHPTELNPALTNTPISARPEYGESEDIDDPRSVTFSFPAGDQNFIIVCGTVGYDVLARIYRQSDYRQVAAVTLPYLESELTELRWQHSLDVLFLVHEDYAPRRLVRYSDTSWALVLAEVIGGPFKDDNETAVEVSLLEYPAWDSSTEYDANDIVTYRGDLWIGLQTGTNKKPRKNSDYWMRHTVTRGETITIVPSDIGFDDAYVGKLFRIYHGSDIQIAEKWGTGATDDSVTATIPVVREVNMRTAGIWQGAVELQFSYDDGVTWQTIYQVESKDGDSNFDVSAESIRPNTLARVQLIDRQSATQDTGLKVYLTAKGDHYLYATLDSVIAGTSGDPDSYSATLQNPISRSPSTNRWAYGAWAGDDGYPSVVAIHEQRLLFAGTKTSGLTFWESRVDDWTDFRLDVTADAAQEWELDAESRADIRWMVSLRQLIIGTSAAEYAFDQAEQRVQRVAKHGSDKITPALSGESIYFVERGGRRIIQFSYDDESVQINGMKGIDSTLMAPHMFRNSKPRQLIWCNLPQPMLFVVRRDGAVCTFIFDREQQVMAWSRCSFGLTLSASVLPAAVGESDELWALHCNTDDDFTTLSSFRIQSNDIDNQIPLLFARDAGPAIFIRHSEDLVAYDNNGMKLSDNCFGTPRLMRLHAPSARTVSTPAGRCVPINGQSAPQTGTNATVYWIPDGIEGGVYDGLTLIDPGDYTVYETPLIYRFRELDTPYVITTVEGVGAGYDMTPYSGGPTDVFMWSPVISITGRTALDYEIFTPAQVFVPGADVDYEAPGEDFWFPMVVGTPVQSLLDTTDMLGSVESGGIGSTARASAVELFVVDSLDCQVSTDQTRYDRVEFEPATQEIGGSITPFTGRRKINTMCGYQTGEGLILTIEKTSPSKLLVAAVGVIAERER